jgi:hypothetical protein
MAAVFASVCLRFFKYLLWYFWSSAIEPLSACILLGEGWSAPLSWTVVTDDSESLEALDESDKESGCGCCCWVNLMRESVIFGEGVSKVDPES